MDTAEDLLNSPDYFTCDRLRCRMPKATCLANQNAGAGKRANFDAYHGISIATLNRRDTCIDCEQGRQIKQEYDAMGERGTCENCRRSDVLLVAGMKDKICWSCQKHAAGTTGDERIKKLAEAAAKYGASPSTDSDAISDSKQQKMKHHIKKSGDEMKQEPNMKPEGAVPDKPTPPPAPSVSDHFNDWEKAEAGKIFLSELHEVVPIDFGPDDRHLLDYVTDLSKKYRRTPDQQILYMLDCNRQADLEAGTVVR